MSFWSIYDIMIVMKKKIFYIALVIFMIDQVSKLILSNYLKDDLVITNFFGLTPLTNTGAAWSFLSNHNYLIVLISLIILVILYRFMLSFKLNKINTVAFGLVFGGILGNLGDRIFHGYVFDFLAFKIFNYDYPVFNLADSFIVIGTIILIIGIMKGDDTNGN
jgi:signal peptidase II